MIAGPNHWLTCFEWMVGFRPKGGHDHMLKQTMTWLAMAVFSVLTAQAQ